MFTVRVVCEEDATEAELAQEQALLLLVAWILEDRDVDVPDSLTEKISA